MRIVCKSDTSPPPQSLLPSPYSVPSSMVGSNGFRVHELTGFTVSICALSSRVGLFSSNHGDTVHTLLASRHVFMPRLSIYPCMMSAAFFSSRLVDGVAISRCSNAMASSVYLSISVVFFFKIHVFAFVFCKYLSFGLAFRAFVVYVFVCRL